MDADLEQVCQRINAAVEPEDLFGAESTVLPPRQLAEFLGKEYRPLKALTDPSKYTLPEDFEAAREAYEKLGRLYEEAKRRIACHLYGLDGRGKLRPSSATKSFVVGTRRYFVGSKITTTPHSTWYRGFLEDNGRILGETEIKLANTPSDNSFIANEVRILDILHERDVPQWKHLPLVLDRFQAGDRAGCVFRKIPGISISDARKVPAHERGVDQRHMVWMLDRVLSGIGYAHRQGVVHGNLTPDNVILQSLTHNAYLIGWEGAVHRPAVSRAKIGIFSDIYTAPEVRERGQIGPWSDIYSVGKIMIWVLGGDPERNEIPQGVKTPLADFLLTLVKEDHQKRPDDAWVLYEEQKRIKDSLWKRKFLHFDAGTVER